MSEAKLKDKKEAKEVKKKEDKESKDTKEANKSKEDLNAEKKANDETNNKAEENAEESKKQEHSLNQSKSRGNKVAIIHVFSSKNDTIITATDLSGAETLAWASGGMVVTSNREEGRPYAAMQAMIKVVNVLKDKGINTVHVWVRAPGGNKSKTPGSGVQVAIRTLARSKMRISRIEDVTPLPTDSMRRKGGRRGRRV